LRAFGARRGIAIELRVRRALLRLLTLLRRGLLRVVPPAVVVLLPAAAFLFPVDVAVVSGIDVAAAGPRNAARSLSAPARDGFAAAAALGGACGGASVVGDA